MGGIRLFGCHVGHNPCPTCLIFWREMVIGFIQMLPGKKARDTGAGDFAEAYKEVRPGYLQEIGANAPEYLLDIVAQLGGVLGKCRTK